MARRGEDDAAWSNTAGTSGGMPGWSPRTTKARSMCGSRDRTSRPTRRDDAMPSSQSSLMATTASPKSTASMISSALAPSTTTTRSTGQFNTERATCSSSGRSRSRISCLGYPRRRLPPPARTTAAVVDAMRGTVARGSSFPNQADDARVSRLVREHDQPRALVEPLRSVDVGTYGHEVEIGELDGYHRRRRCRPVVDQLAQGVVEGVEDSGRHRQIEGPREIGIRRVAALPPQPHGIVHHPRYPLRDKVDEWSMVRDEQTTLRDESAEVAAGTQPVHELLHQIHHLGIRGEAGSIDLLSEVVCRRPADSGVGENLGPLVTVGGDDAPAGRLDAPLCRGEPGQDPAASRLG